MLQIACPSCHPTSSVKTLTKCLAMTLTSGQASKWQKHSNLRFFDVLASLEIMQRTVIQFNNADKNRRVGANTDIT